MADKAPVDIRGTLLRVISEQHPKGATDGSLQSGSVLRESARRIGAALNLELEQALLSQLHDLFRTGYLSWGYNISNPNPPFFHVTVSGRRLLEKLTRDPANPKGYRAHLYCPHRGMGEKPSPSGEDFSKLAVWNITVDRATPFTI